MEIAQFFNSELMKSKVVFVTGGGSGINLGVAKNFAALGADIAICGRTQEKLDGAAEELKALGARVYTHACDVRHYDNLAEAIQGTESALGSIDVLICGAAGNFPSPAESLSPNGFRSVIDIDLLGSFHACHAAVDQLKKTKGSIIFISAGQAYVPYALQCHVGAAKAGIDNLMRNLALEWGPYGIRSNSIAPGPIDDTEGMKRLAPGDTKGKIEKVVPMGRFGTVDEIGHAAVFLASPLARYVTGTRLDCDGGMNLPGSGVFTNVLMEELH